MTNEKTRPRYSSLIYLHGSAMTPIQDKKIGVLQREIKYIKAIAKNFNEVHLFSPDTKDVIQDIAPNVTAHAFPFNIGKLTKFAYYILTPIMFFRIFRASTLIKCKEFSGGLPFVIAKRLHKKKGLISYRWNWSDGAKKDPTKGRFNYIIRKAIENFCFKNADVITTTSSSLKDVVEKHGVDNDKIIVLPNFIECDVFKPDKKIQNDNLEILLIGRLVHIKNYPLVLEAAHMLSQKGIKLKTTIIGQGPLKKDLLVLADKYKIKLEIIDRVSNEKVPEYINKSLIYVMCSRSEGNPKALLEAMSCEKSVIGTNVRGIRDIIKNQENGLLCEEKPESLADSIERLITDPILRNKLSKNARKYVKETCSFKRILEKEIDIYDRLLEQCNVVNFDG